MSFLHYNDNYDFVCCDLLRQAKFIALEANYLIVEYLTVEKATDEHSNVKKTVPLPHYLKYALVEIPQFHGCDIYNS